MDAKRFDDLARSVGNRRGLIRGALGAAAAVIGLDASNVLAACRPGGWSCQRNSDCCSNECYQPSKTDRKRVCKACTPNPDEVTCRGVECGSVLNNCGQSVECPGNCSRLNNQCNVGVCHGNACYAVPTPGKQCDDGDICTNSVCSIHGQCVGTPKCDDGDPCTVDTCNRETGACGYTDKCPPEGPCVTVSCRAGECITTPIEGCCVDSEDCAAGFSCDDDECVCACETATKVPEGGSVCIDFTGGCDFECSDDSDCPEDWICIDDGFCEFTHCHPLCGSESFRSSEVSGH